MSIILTSLLAQWPALVVFVFVGFIFWRMFEKSLSENKENMLENKLIINEYKKMLDQKLSDSKQLLEEYRTLSEQKVKEIERLQKQFMGLLDENDRANKRYDEMRNEFAKLLVENHALKRTIDRIEEMLRATGGDVKVISTELRKAQNDIETMANKVNMIGYKKENT